MGEYILIVGEHQEVVGYACPLFYVSLGEVYKNMLDAEKADPNMFNPSLVNACREQDVARHVTRQKQVLEDDCWGDWHLI